MSAEELARRVTGAPKPGRVYQEDVMGPELLKTRKRQLRSKGWEIVSSVFVDTIHIPGMFGVSESYTGPGWRLKYRMSRAEAAP